jgi:hypothetical protein
MAAHFASISSQYIFCSFDGVGLADGSRKAFAAGLAWQRHFLPGSHFGRLSAGMRSSYQSVFAAD